MSLVTFILEKDFRLTKSLVKLLWKISFILVIISNLMLKLGGSTLNSLKYISVMGKESSIKDKASHLMEVTAFICWFCQYLARGN